MKDSIKKFVIVIFFIVFVLVCFKGVEHHLVEKYTENYDFVAKELVKKNNINKNTDNESNSIQKVENVENNVNVNKVVNVEDNNLEVNNQELSSQGVKIDNGKIKYSCKEVNSWHDGNSTNYQYAITIENQSDEILSDYWFEINKPEYIKFVQIWNCIYRIDGNKVKLTPEDSIDTLYPKATTELGFIVILSESINQCQMFKSDVKNTVTNKEDDKNNNINNSSIVNNEVNSQSAINTENTTNGTNTALYMAKKEYGELNIFKNKEISYSDNIFKDKLSRIYNNGAMVTKVSQTPFEKHGKLHVDGINIKDKNDEIVQLQGISTHSISAFGQYVNKETFKELRDNWHINVIRLAMYTDKNDGYTKGLHSKVIEATKQASELGIYVIIDWHILMDFDPNFNKENAKVFFKEMSEEFKNYENVIYEICNEPNSGVKWSSSIKPYAEEIIPIIRANDKDGIIIVGTPQWSQDVDIVAEDRLADTHNIMYTLHFYADTHKEKLREKLQIAIAKDLPIFVTEFGISDASGNGNINENEGNIWIDLLNKNNISWVCWNLSNKDESSALINSNCNKISGFEDSDLSGEGKWLKGKLAE